MSVLLGIYSFIFGLLIGSFLNVLILRLPIKKDIVKTRSACPHCGTQLTWYHNIPIFSFVFLRGKCAFCKTPISLRYPLIELLTGLISFWLCPNEFNSVALTQYFFYFTVACIFIVHFMIDLDHQLLLDSINIYLLVIVLTHVLFFSSFNHWMFGGLIGFCVPLLVTWLFYKIRGQIGLGGGDIKLFGILGLYLGPVGIVFNIFLSSLVGAVIGSLLIGFKKITKDKPMAFGPAIILVAAFQIYFPDLAKMVQSWFF
jgi:prepilin signal peptidase PulO-like enzyme (type II secretory pathway)